MLLMSGHAWLMLAGLLLEVVHAGDQALIEDGLTYGAPGVPTATEALADCRVLVSLLEAAELAGVGPELLSELDRVRSAIVALCVERSFDPGEWRRRVRDDFLLPELPAEVVHGLWHITLSRQAPR